MINVWMGHYYRYNKHGILPTSGGWEDQDPKVVQVFDLITTLTLDNGDDDDSE